MRESNIDIKCPKGWRKGQAIFNFLWYLREIGYSTEPVGFEENGKMKYAEGRMADPFHISNSELEKFYQEFLDRHGK